MPATASKIESRILREYEEKTPGSARLYQRARRLFPDGVTHVGRYLQPHPIYVSRAASSRKWDVDGNEYVDYFGGHGALLLGHNHPVVAEAVREQLARGSHYGASHELEVEWAELIQEMIPCAERVRFVNSGTEATLLALRLARAYTGKPMVVRFGGHFHGWHDQVAFAPDASPGIPKAVADQVLVLPPNDIAPLRELCGQRDDIAAVILEPTGATFGHIPLPRQFLADLRDITSQRRIVLIFDEVVTGFRCSAGGAQGLYGITPDLAPLAKIVAGGHPGAALAGRADILRSLEFQDDSEQLKLPAIPHQGTFNGAPVSAAAGIATLRLIRDSDAIAQANRTAAAIRDGMNDAIRRVGASWCVYGEFSDFHIFCHPGREPISPADIQSGKVPWTKLKGATPLELLHKVRTGFLLHGVDIIGWPGGLVSAAHTAQDVDRTVTAFERLLRMLAEEGEVA